MNILLKENVLPELEFQRLLTIIDENKHEITPYEINTVAGFERWYPEQSGCTEIIRLAERMLDNQEWKREVASLPDLAWKRYAGDDQLGVNVQITRYQPNAHNQFKWHVDHIGDYRPPRVLNYIFYLTDDFDGGELEISSVTDEQRHARSGVEYPVAHRIKPKKNMLVMMPAWYIHRVLPVASGGSRLTLNGHIY